MCSNKSDSQLTRSKGKLLLAMQVAIIMHLFELQDTGSSGSQLLANGILSSVVSCRG